MINEIITTENNPIKIWADTLEDTALVQAKNLANLPFLFKHVALMPDAHPGYGMPIGGIAAFKGAIVPNCVGVDIGCGMISAKTNMPVEEYTVKMLINTKRGIIHQIPVGKRHHKTPQEWEGLYTAPDIEIINEQLDAASYQLGTLGGGNHFIEIQKGDDGFVWIMLHSGSRNVGYRIANHYHKLAISLCKKWYSDLPHKDLSFFPWDSEEGREYFSAMSFALDFAYANRRKMLKRVEEVFSHATNGKGSIGSPHNIHHNYAVMENHFGENVIVHRKGATSAKKGQVGIIPGSQGTSSYLVEGLGNPDSFQSCSHGAGRKMGRAAAKRNLDLISERAKMDSLGILHNMTEIEKLDEAPGAYKDINTVMANQEDLVRTLRKFIPLAAIKE